MQAKQHHYTTDDDAIRLIILTIKHQGDVFQVDMEEDSTVVELKAKLASLLNLSVERQRLIFQGRILRDADTLTALEDATIHVIKLAEGQNPTNQEDGNNPSNFELPSLVGMNQGEKGHEKMIKQMLDHPMFKQLSMNEDFLKSMFLNNPQMKKLVEENPELGHAMTDPAMLHDALEMMRNPSYQREMMRNQDRAISNIENLPEGFNALRRTWSSIQKPMMEALDETIQKKLDQFPGSSSVKTKGKKSPDTSTFESPHINTEPLPNPWTTKPRSAPFSNSFPYIPQGQYPWNQSPMMQNTNQRSSNSPKSTHRAPSSSNSPLFSMNDVKQTTEEIIANSGIHQRPRPRLDSASSNSTKYTSQDRRSRSSSFSSFAAPTTPNMDQSPYSERYQVELDTLEQMGFQNRDENLQALISNEGNIQKATEWLLYHRNNTRPN
jgi:ubiquilin